MCSCVQSIDVVALPERGDSPSGALHEFRVSVAMEPPLTREAGPKPKRLVDAKFDLACRQSVVAHDE